MCHQGAQRSQRSGKDTAQGFGHKNYPEARLFNETKAEKPKKRQQPNHPGNAGA